MANASPLANGLRRHVASAARRWAVWPNGAEHHRRVLAAIAAAATSDNDLRAILEWTTYQSASLAAARTIALARRARRLSRRLGLLDDDAPALQLLTAGEVSLIELIRTRGAYMAALADQFPQLGLPPPLVTPELLAEPPARPPGRLALIAALRGRRKD